MKFNLKKNEKLTSSKTTDVISDSSPKKGSFLVRFLKCLAYFIFLPVSWLAGIYWFLVKRKKLNNQPERKRKESIKVVLLTVFSFFIMLRSIDFFTTPSNPTELDSEHLAIQDTEKPEVKDEVIVDTSTIETEFSTENSIASTSTELETDTSAPETDTSAPETEFLTESETINNPTSEEPAVSEIESENNEVLVWVDDTAKRYHKKNGCGMDNAYQVTLEEAIAMGKTPCKRCYP